jgi:dTDP-4-amino-4,6-dideoxygalactose transaminase
MKIAFSPPFVDEDVKREVMEALESGWITSGPKVLALEKLVAEQVGIKHAVCCNSATSGLSLMLHWYGIGKGDEVIIPVYTYAATALVVMHAGATPVMVDCGPDFNIDVGQLRRKITSRTKAIIPVDIAGFPCDYDAMNSIVTSSEVRALFRHSTIRQAQLGRIMMLSDSAHSIGSYYKGKRAGKLADFTVFSFHAVKNVTTAEGGAICINLPEADFKHEDVYKQLKLWSLNGQTKDAFTKTQGGSWRYDIVYPGFKINMPDICAAIGLAQLRKYDSLILKERARVFESYSRAFGSFPWSELPPAACAEIKPSYHLYALRIKNITETQRDQMIDRITGEGVSVNVHFQPLPLLSIFKENGHDIKDYPRAFDNYSREISLPIYPELDDKKIAHIVKVVKGAYESVVEQKSEELLH